jgi:hypothetical protein
VADNRTYNARVTTEALEKKFRDTFPSQAGAELVDDLYASGVIVPIVDFTAAAEGSGLRSDLQTAWDFATGFDKVTNTTTTILTNTGFWQFDLNMSGFATVSSAQQAILRLDDGTTTKPIWQFDSTLTGLGNSGGIAVSNTFVVYLRSGDSVEASCSGSCTLDVWYRQIADVSGNLVNPLGFTSS